MNKPLSAVLSAALLALALTLPAPMDAATVPTAGAQQALTGMCPATGPLVTFEATTDAVPWCWNQLTVNLARCLDAPPNQQETCVYRAWAIFWECEGV